MTLTLQYVDSCTFESVAPPTRSKSSRGREHERDNTAQDETFYDNIVYLGDLAYRG